MENTIENLAEFISLKCSKDLQLAIAPLLAAGHEIEKAKIAIENNNFDEARRKVAATASNLSELLDTCLKGLPGGRSHYHEEFLKETGEPFDPFKKITMELLKG